MSDCEKFERLGFAKDPGTGPDIFARFFDDITMDIQTGELMGRYVSEERDTGRRLRACHAALQAAQPAPAGSTNDAAAAALMERLDRIECTLTELAERATKNERHAANGTQKVKSSKKQLTAQPQISLAMWIQKSAARPSDSMSMRSSLPWKRVPNDSNVTCGREQPGAVGDRALGRGRTVRRCRRRSIPGISSAPGYATCVAFDTASHSALPPRRLGGVELLQRSDLRRGEPARRAPRAGARRHRPGWCRAPCGCRPRCRRASGIMLVFCPPCTTFGENVVWVPAWHVRASAGGSVSMRRPDARRVEQRRLQVVGRRAWTPPWPARRRRCTRRAGTARGGARPRPPSRARCRHRTASSRATGCPSRAAAARRCPSRRCSRPLAGRCRRRPTTSRRSRSARSRCGSRPSAGRTSTRRPTCRRPPRRRRRSRSACPSAAIRCERQLAEGDRHRRGDVQHVDRTATPHLAVDQFAAERDRATNRPGSPAPRRCGPSGTGSVLSGRSPRCERRSNRGRACDSNCSMATPAPVEVGLEQLGVAHLAARLGRAVVHALVADERLQQLGGGSGQVGDVGHRPI